MDPNATLKRIRELVKECMALPDASCDDPDRTQALAGHVADLDEWLSKGGALPTRWAR